MRIALRSAPTTLLLTAAFLFGRTCLAADELVAFTAELDRFCGPVRSTANAEGTIDYRMQSVDRVAAQSIENLDRFHTDLAQAELARSSPNRSVIANLDFTLKGSPNHARALQMLVKYDLMGGRKWEFATTECYLSWARQRAPDDVDVHVIGGYYFWKKRDLQRAESWWNRALELNPASGDANYNMGLLYLERRDYDRALERAHAAYAAGYPLMGLKKGLERAGRWVAPRPAAEPG